MKNSLSKMSSHDKERSEFTSAHIAILVPPGILYGNQSQLTWVLKRKQELKSVLNLIDDLRLQQLLIIAAK